MRMLDVSILGGSWPAFRKHHVILGGWQGREIMAYKNEAELERKVNRHCFRKLLRECADIPEEVHVTRTCDMTPEQIRVTADLRKRMLAELETDEGEAWIVNAAQVMVRLLRFNQISSGFLQTDLDSAEGPGQVVRFKPNPKLELLISILKEEIPEGQKAVIWCAYQADVREIIRGCKAAKIGAVPFYGEMKMEDRHRSEDQFKTAPDCKVIVATPETGGFGLNWQVAPNCIFYSYNFNWGNIDQAKARIRRITQQQRMTFMWLVAENPNTRMRTRPVGWPSS
jgi:SNF2 family DNA or RNA helicase